MGGSAKMATARGAAAIGRLAQKNKGFARWTPIPRRSNILKRAVGYFDFSETQPSEPVRGLEGLIVLARQPEGRVMLLEEIAETGRLPSRFLAQIFQKLRCHNVVASHRGAILGYSLARPASRITLTEIFQAIEGPDFLGECVFWSGHCNGKNPCVLHDRWAAIRPRLQELLARTTLDEVAR